MGNHQYRHYGRLEVCINGTRNQICSTRITHETANVVCHELGFSRYGAVVRPSAERVSIRYFQGDIMCDGNENSILACNISKGSALIACSSAAEFICQEHNPSLSPTNCSQFSVKLDVDGKLLVCLNGIWSAVCRLTTFSAGIVCNQLGYQRRGYRFTSHYLQHNTLLVNQIRCSGNPNNISQCNFEYFTPPSYCRSVVGLECAELCDDGDVRLSDSNYVGQGVVEVCVNGNWNSMCGGSLSRNSAGVICQQLGYSRHGALVLPSRYRTYTSGIPPINCTGSEKTWLECQRISSRCFTTNDATIACQLAETPVADCYDGEIRIKNESNAVRGPLEFCENNVWFLLPWNSYYWSSRPWNRDLVCASLGYPFSEISSFGTYATYNPVYSRYIYCSRNSKSFSLNECSNWEYRRRLGSNVLVVGVECKIQDTDQLVRIVGSNYNHLGAVEILINGTWSRICNDYWDNADASVVCNQLGYSREGAIAFAGSYNSYRSIISRYFNCSGMEQSIFDCQYNPQTYCNRYSHASIMCQNNPIVTNCNDNDIRIRGGPTALEGTVEICKNRVWGGICQYQWDNSDANVVCSQLGFQQRGSTPVYGSFYGKATGPVYLTSMRCNGRENKITDCRSSPATAGGCGDGQYAGVKCIESCEEGKIRLRSSSSSLSGRIEICIELSWTTVCDDSWDSNDASVVCNQLGYSRYGSLVTSSYGEGQLSFGITQIHCNGTEPNITSCYHSMSSLHNCNTYEDAGVVCQEATTIPSNCTDGNVRLVGGTGDHEGRVEVCLNRAWGTICDNGWDSADGNVVCNQLGFLKRGSTAHSRAYFGRGTGPIFYSNVLCRGSESSLERCNKNVLRTDQCNHYEDAGVTCQLPCMNGEARIGRGLSMRIGVVEVCMNSSWGTICSRSWSSSEASVICRQLGHSPYGAFVLTNEFSDNVWPTLLYNVNCSGQESTIWECQYMLQRSFCRYNEDASVLCQNATVEAFNCTHGAVRLKGGRTENEGTVEFCYHQVWGTVCDDFWSTQDANIVCGQLGFQKFGAVARRGGSFARGSGPILINRVFCTGSEMSLLECQWSASSASRCSHSEDAGVICQALCEDGRVRIGGRMPQLFGVLEVCVNTTWVAICGIGWENINAAVACRQLGHSPYGAIASDDFITYSGIETLLTNITCQGTEKNLMQCDVHYISHQEGRYCRKAGVVCQDASRFANCADGDIQLVGSSLSNEGRIEICINRAWGTICDDHWDIVDANIACTQLGFQPFGSIPYYSARYGRGSNNILIGNLYCSGEETSLIQCNRNDNGLRSCGRNEVAGLYCEEYCTDGTVRIVGGPSDLIGRVEVCVNRTWGTVCGNNWNDLDALVLCRQMGHSPNGAIAGSGAFSVFGRPTYLRDVTCNGSENSVFHCQHSSSSFSCSSQNLAGVICQDIDIQYSNCTHGAIRLAGAVKSISGIVEVCIHGIWGAVCDDGWDYRDADVACGQLGYFPFGSTPRYASGGGKKPKPFVMADLFCSGREESLSSCRRNIFGVTHCSRYEYAGIKCLGSFPVHLSHRVGSLLGGDSIMISGVTFEENDEITCKFGEVVVDGIYITEENALCVSPPATEESVVDFTIQVERKIGNISGGARYQYISPLQTSETAEIQTATDSIWIIGEMANFSWNPSALMLSEFMNREQIHVDISLWIYNDVTDKFKETLIVATDLPNTGSASIMLTESLSSKLPDTDSSSLIFYPKISINSSTSIIRTKRSNSKWRKIISKVAKFGKARIISKIKTAITARLLCEAFALTPPVPRRSIPPCPCTEESAIGDDRFEIDALPGIVRTIFHKGSKSCFRQANVRDFGPGQKCCYGNDGNIITGSNGGSAALVAPTNWETTTLHILVDVVPWVLCCSSIAKPLQACHRYTRIRPVDDCSDWPERPPPARMFGDPHIVTLDGYQYTFNGNGEFTLVETHDQSFRLQGRMTEPLAFNNTQTGGTSFSALAMKLHQNPVIQLEVMNDTLIVLIDGDPLDFAGLTEQRIGNITVVDKGNDTITIRMTPGISIGASKRNGILTNVVVTLPEHFITKGLLGQFNGDSTDDLLSRNGTLLSTNSSVERIYYEFGLSWIVDNPSESLFTYGINGDWEFYNNVDYIPAFEPVFSSPELEQEARDVCGDNQLCIFDIAATGDVNIGSSTVESVEVQAALKEQFVPRFCNPPCANGACIGNNTCHCSEGYQGSTCETEVFEECDTNLCENKANCKVLAGDYICECLEGYMGAFCENKVEATTILSPSTVPVASVAAAVIVVVLVIVLIIIVAVIGVWFIRSQRMKSTTLEEFQLEEPEKPEKQVISKEEE